MSFLGHVENGSIALDSPIPLPNGTPVNIETVPAKQSLASPPPAETAEEWITRLKTWIGKQPVRDIEFDDSRESIYP